MNFNQTARVTIGETTYTSTGEYDLPVDEQVTVTVSFGTTAKNNDLDVVKYNGTVLADEFGDGSYLITFSAGDTLEIGLDAQALTLPANATASWIADADEGITAKDDQASGVLVPVGAEVTVEYEAADDTATDWASVSVTVGGSTNNADSITNGNGSGTKAAWSYTFTMTEDTTEVTATPVANTYTVSVGGIVGSGYDLTTDKNAYEKGETVTVTLTAKNNGVTSNSTLSGITATPSVASISEANVVQGTVDTKETITFKFTIAENTEITGLTLA